MQYPCYVMWLEGKTPAYIFRLTQENGATKAERINYPTQDRSSYLETASSDLTNQLAMSPKHHARVATELEWKEALKEVLHNVKGRLI